MERFSDTNAIETMLRELRPAPRPEFVAELDGRAATGFTHGDSRVRRVLSRLRALPPRRILTPAAVSAVAVVAIATAVVSTTGKESAPSTRANISEAVQPQSRQEESLLNSFSGVPAHAKADIQGFSAASTSLGHRRIERSARIALLADPDDVADDSAQVFAAVHDAHGIVLRSNTTQGAAGRAGATFDLLVPSARLGDALAAISAIDEVGSRHDATADITAPTVAVGKRLHETRAGIDSLLSQLASAETESEREALEIELRRERGHAAALEAQLAHLHRRTHYSHLSVRIETGSAASPGGPWGFDDALGSAGHILGVAAGVTLVGLAVLAPLAILVLLAWLAHRTWLRIRRERALS
jgi:hypothetical protein